MRVIETKVVGALKSLDKVATSVKTTGSITVSDSIRAECRQNQGLLWEHCHGCLLLPFLVMLVVNLIPRQVHRFF